MAAEEAEHGNGKGNRRWSDHSHVLLPDISIARRCPQPLRRALAHSDELMLPALAAEAVEATRRTAMATVS